MKRWICILLMVLLVLSLCACGKENNNDTAASIPADDTTSTQPPDSSNTPIQTQDEPAASAATSGIDVDLTALSSTMVYSEVYNMLYYDPESYYGKTVKMSGVFSTYQMVVDGVVQPDPVAYGCIIADATACCAQGMEYVLEGDYTYPEDYPELGTEITVIGEFQSYEDNGMTWYHLINARME